MANGEEVDQGAQLSAELLTSIRIPVETGRPWLEGDLLALITSALEPHSASSRVEMELACDNEYLATWAKRTLTRGGHADRLAADGRIVRLFASWPVVEEPERVEPVPSHPMPWPSVRERPSCRPTKALSKVCRACGRRFVAFAPARQYCRKVDCPKKILRWRHGDEERHQDAKGRPIYQVEGRWLTQRLAAQILKLDDELKFLRLQGREALKALQALEAEEGAKRAAGLTKCTVKAWRHRLDHAVWQFTEMERWTSQHGGTPPEYREWHSERLAAEGQGEADVRTDQALRRDVGLPGASDWPPIGRWVLPSRLLPWAPLWEMAKPLPTWCWRRRRRPRDAKTEADIQAVD